jgi:hypothetical protein
MSVFLHLRSVPYTGPRKRQPLPPQSLRFREAAQKLESVSSVPIWRKDGGMQRSTNIGSPLPSGPRNQPPHQQALPKDSNQSDFSRGSRPLPSGPSASSVSRGRPRVSNEPSPLHEGPYRSDRDADVDVDLSSRSQRSNVHEATIKNRGMYADRELNVDVPTGPRPRIKTSPRSGTSPTTATSPTIPYPTNRVQVQGQTHFRPRDRSPSAQAQTRSNWDRGTMSQSRHQQQGPVYQGEEGTVWTSDNARDRAPSESQVTRREPEYTSVEPSHVRHSLCTLHHPFIHFIVLRSGSLRFRFDGLPVCHSLRTVRLFLERAVFPLAPRNRHRHLRILHIHLLDPLDTILLLFPCKMIMVIQ